MNNAFKTLTIWVLLLLTVMLIFNYFNQPSGRTRKVLYSEFLMDVEGNKVDSVAIQGQKISGRYKDGTEFKTYMPPDSDLIKILREKNVKIEVKPEEGGFWQNALISWLPMLLFIGVWIFFMKQMQSGQGKALSFGKARFKTQQDSKNRITFADVAGIEEAKEELKEIIDFLKDPKKFTRLGARIPKGVLLVGSPGTGKTLLAKAIAGEAGVPFFSISGSDFVEMFVGVGASRVRDLFDTAKKNAPCIIFIDEIDAVGRQRGAGLGGGHDEREQTLNQLLVEMDGFDPNTGIIVIAATNRPDILDPALLRPGRFDRQVVVPKPDVRGREQILKVHTAKIPLAPDVDLALLAKGTPGFSGADLANMVNEAALLAARMDKNLVDMECFEKAKDKVMMGVERKSMVIGEEEKRITAYHEAGHTLVAKMLPGSDPIHKVSIIPRGMALGITQLLPIDDKHNYTKDYLLNNLAILLGGRAAEEVVLGKMTTGAGNDLERATELARKMVCEWGMSERLGPVTFGKRSEHIFLGRDFAEHKNYSEKTAIEIDNEIKHIVTTSYEKAKDIITKNRDKLEKLVEMLLVKETLDGKEIDIIIGGSGVQNQVS
jgi:cell division protease FtsH